MTVRRLAGGLAALALLGTDLQRPVPRGTRLATAEQPHAAAADRPLCRGQDCRRLARRYPHRPIRPCSGHPAGAAVRILAPAPGSATERRAEYMPSTFARGDAARPAARRTARVRNSHDRPSQRHLPRTRRATARSRLAAVSRTAAEAGARVRRRPELGARRGPRQPRLHHRRIGFPYTTPGVAYQDGRIARRTPAGHPSETARGRISELAPGQPNDNYLPWSTCGSKTTCSSLTGCRRSPRMTHRVDSPAGWI